MLARTMFGAAALALTAIAVPAAAQSDLVAEAEAALRVWFDASAAGDLDALNAVLAPEFQILRASGEGFDKEDYLAGNTPNLIDYAIEEAVATRSDDVMVVRYVVVVNETIGGAAVEARSPRLTVLRLEGDGWLVVAHANFAQIE